MSTRVKAILIISLVFLFLGGMMVFETYKDYIHSNADSFTGNTTGNINNGGYLCEYDGVVYFANPYYNGYLYAMTPQEENIRMISQVSAYMLNTDSKNLYYYVNSGGAPSSLGGFTVQTLGLFKAERNGKGMKQIEKIICGAVRLIGNDLYYQRYDNETGRKTMARYNIRSHENEIVYEYADISPAAGDGGYIYYTGLESDHNLYRMNCETLVPELVAEGNIWFPDKQGNLIYYMDADDNYKICVYDMTNGQKTTLTQDRADNYLVVGGYIFYQRNSDDPAMMMMHTDGSDLTELQKGIYTGLSASSDYFYFWDYTSGVPMYHVLLTDPNHNVTEFTAAHDAALDDMQR